MKKFIFTVGFSCILVILIVSGEFAVADTWCTPFGFDPPDLYKCVDALPDYTLTTIYGQPPSDNNQRLDFFFLGEAFDEQSNQEKTILFRNAERFVNELLYHEPYTTYRNFLNVHVLWLTSPDPAMYGYYESGYDYPDGKAEKIETKIEVDNTDTTCNANGANCFEVVSGNWSTSTNPGQGSSPAYYGSDYLVATETGAKAKWTFEVPEDGKYSLWVFYTNDNNNTVKARYEIYVNSQHHGSYSKDQSFGGEGGLYTYEGIVKFRWNNLPPIRAPPG